MERYEESKDSGVEWIGEIPEHWKVMRLRFLSKIKTGEKDTENRKYDGEYPFYVSSQTVERISTYSFDGEAVILPIAFSSPTRSALSMPINA